MNQYLDKMTSSELNTLITVGLSSASSQILLNYIDFGVSSKYSAAQNYFLQYVFDSDMLFLAVLCP